MSDSMTHSSPANGQAQTQTQRITRLSPHQNGKVGALLMAVGSLVFLLPMLLVFAAVAPAHGDARPPFAMLLVLPLLYLVFGYLSIAFGCWLYNLLTRWTGGFEFASAPGDATITPP